MYTPLQYKDVFRKAIYIKKKNGQNDNSLSPTMGDASIGLKDKEKAKYVGDGGTAQSDSRARFDGHLSRTLVPSEPSMKLNQNPKDKMPTSAASKPPPLSEVRLVPTSFGNLNTNWNLGEWVNPDWVHDKSEAIIFIRSETAGIKMFLQMEVDTNNTEEVFRILNGKTLADVDLDQVITIEYIYPKGQDDDQSISSVTKTLMEYGWSFHISDSPLRKTKNHKHVIVFITTSLLRTFIRETHNITEQNVNRTKRERTSNDIPSETNETSTKKKSKAYDNEHNNLFESSDSNKSTDEEEDGLSVDSNKSTDEEDGDLEQQMSSVNQSLHMMTRSGRKKMKKTNSKKKVLLVYPFELDESAMEEAVLGLKELGGDSLGVESGDEEPPTDVRTQAQSDRDGAGIKESRKHFITVYKDDTERLGAGKFLNDALIDFWMSW